MQRSTAVSFAVVFLLLCPLSFEIGVTQPYSQNLASLNFFIALLSLVLAIGFLLHAAIFYKPLQGSMGAREGK